MKKFNKKLLAGLVLGSVVATGALYAKGNAGMNCSYDMKGGNYKSSHNFKSQNHKGKMPILRVMKELNLSDTQKDKIKKIVQDQMKSKTKLSDSFSKNSFDKELFIKTMNEKKDDRVKNKAAMIEKVYAVLTSKQKEQFKTLIELREDRKHSRFN